MNEKNLWGLAIISSLATCGLLIPIWAIILLAYYISKIFSKPKPVQVPQPKVILPDNTFASDWTFVIREREYGNSKEES